MAFQKGYIPWNKGLTKNTDERMLALANKVKGQHRSIRTEFSNGNKGYWLGKKLNDKDKMKISNTILLSYQNGRKVWNKGLTKETDERIRKKGMKHSFIMKGRKPSKETIKKRLGRRTMSSLERKFSEIIDKYNLPYKFVGNGKFFIERKNPDFINCNGEKIAIEVYYKGHKCIVNSKERFDIGYDENKLTKWRKEREIIFEKYGWKVLFFDEKEVNENNILKIIGSNLK